MTKNTKDKTIDQLVKQYKAIDRNQLANSIIRAHLKQVESCVMESAHQCGVETGLHALFKLQEWLDEFAKDAKTRFADCPGIKQHSRI